MHWECPACKKVNKQICQKPRPFQGVVFGSTCGLCKNDFTIKVVKSNGGKVGYLFIDGPKNKLSENEIDKLLTDAKASLTKEEV